MKISFVSIKNIKINPELHIKGHRYSIISVSHRFYKMQMPNSKRLTKSKPVKLKCGCPNIIIINNSSFFWKNCSAGQNCTGSARCAAELGFVVWGCLRCSSSRFHPNGNRQSGMWEYPNRTARLFLITWILSNGTVCSYRSHKNCTQMVQFRSIRDK